MKKRKITIRKMPKRYLSEDRVIEIERQVRENYAEVWAFTRAEAEQLRDKLTKFLFWK